MKRIFTDADIYEDEWYQNLPIEIKLFWDYICRRCQYGVWKPNMSLAKFQLGIDIDTEKAIKALNIGDKKRVELLKDGRWWIPAWITFQYPTLSQDCPAHRPLFKFYERHYKYLLDRYLIGISTLQEVCKSKDNNKGDCKGGFEVFWKAYPKKVGKGAAEVSWKRHLNGKPGAVHYLILPALEAQKKSDQWKKENGQYIPNPATWLNQKRWLDEVPDGKPVDPNREKKINQKEVEMREMADREFARKHNNSGGSV